MSQPTALQKVSEDEARCTLLKQETDHFFQAELYHDQRASWLLALASALLTIVLGVLLAISDGKLSARGRPLLILATASFSGAILSGLFALWPLAGRDGTLWMPIGRPESPRGLCLGDLTPETHYQAHRRRAGRKANRIVCVLVWLLLGVLLALAGMTLAVGIGAPVPHPATVVGAASH
jgi:hypothetical protein